MSEATPSVRGAAPRRAAPRSRPISQLATTPTIGGNTIKILTRSQMLLVPVFIRTVLTCVRTVDIATPPSRAI